MLTPNPVETPSPIPDSVAAPAVAGAARSGAVDLNARFHRAIVETMLDGLHAVDRSGVIRYASPSLLAILGYRSDELIGRPGSDFVHPDDVARTVAAVEYDVRTPGASRRIEARVRHADGSWRTLEMAGRSFVEEGGEPLLIVTSRDITARRRAEEELRASEARYRRFFEDDLTGDFISTVEGRLVACNQAFVQMVGYDSVEEVLATPSVAFYPDPEARAALLERLRAERVIHHLELELVGKHGRRIRALENLVANFDDAGNLVSFHGYVFDISEQRRLAEEHTALLARERAARAQAEAAERRSALLAEVGSVLDASLDYRATLINLARFLVPALADYCLIDEVPLEGGTRRVAAVHRDPGVEPLLLQDDCNPPDADPALHPVVAVLASGTPRLVEAIDTEELQRLAHSAEHRELLKALGLRSYIIVPLAARGRKLGALTLAFSSSGRQFTVQDLEFAESVATRAALAVDNARLYGGVQQAARAREEVLASVSHDLRNPLATILLNASALIETIPADRLHPEEREQLEWIAHSSQQMNRMIQDLLDVARIESGRLPIRPVEQDVAMVIRHARMLMQPLAGEAGVRLEADSIEPSLVARFDRERVVRVLSNLIGNALKFTPAGGSVHLSAARSGPDVRVEVRDTGVGISAEEKPHLFDRYWQGGRARRGGPESGSGLGLAIARGIVQAHGGSIWCDSRPGDGATFVFTLPVAGPPERSP